MNTKDFYDIDGYYHSIMWSWDYDMMCPFLVELWKMDLL